MTVIFGRFVGDFNSFASDDADPSAFRDTVDTFVLWFIYLFVGRFAASYIANLAVSLAAIRTTTKIRKKLLNATLRQEIWHFDKETIGSIASQVTTNGNKINQGIAEKLAAIIQSIATFWAAFIVALTFQWKLTLIVMTLIPGIVVILSIGMTIDAGQEAKMVQIYSQAAVLAQEALSSVKTVHSFWAHEKLAARYDDFLVQGHKVGKKKSPNVGLVQSTNQFCTLAGMALAFWQGFRMFASGEIDSAGTVLTVLLSVTIGTTGLLQISMYIASIGGAASAANELFTLMAKPSELDPLSTDGDRPDKSRGDIELRGINFAYPSRPSAKVLDEFSLHIPAGKTTALVGASGCGKSTIVGLLDRWYVPESGEILLDGKDLSSYNTQWLRSNIRIVQQENILFRGTVFENVAKGLVGPQRELPAEEQLRLVQEACKQSNAHDFIQAMPEGYQTQVGERARMLSGGQKQRLAIARSIISNPSVLLLDEATSALGKCLSLFS
jgi:ATP-binding cassette subfamily B (MDR/TAP) protein 1